ncbi:cupin domain-containing protein [Butyrivibrio sp. DSM 10294]|nr:cupin domain-containing protein [Butyrivibrio sp. DSM 10294]
MRKDVYSMEFYADSNKIIDEMKRDKRHSCDVLTAENGCVAGCKAGFTFYESTEYGKGGVHADQEGFLVLEGMGKARFDDKEFDVYPGLAMIAPAGTVHAIKRNEDSEAVKVFWFHSA